MILIDALFINNGGGEVLLKYFIEHVLISPRKKDFFFLLDPRFKRPSLLDQNYLVIPNDLISRLKFYLKSKNNYTTVFCFANTPPPIRLKVPTYTYFHNQKLLEAPKHKFNRDYFSIYFKKFMAIRLFNNNTDYYIVQTPHMVYELVARGLKNEAHCLRIPFYDDQKYTIGFIPFGDRIKDEFVYISNPSPQKNYSILLDAWEYLLEQGYFPHLNVTVDDTAKHILDKIDRLKNKGARITNHIRIDPRNLYFNCPYLIFPSVMESFGLPLVEAVDSGMKVLASDLEFVYDVIEPSLTFNPFDKVSIASAVIIALTSDLPFPKNTISNRIEQLLNLLA